VAAAAGGGELRTGEVTASNVNAPRNRAGLNLAYKWKQLGINWVTTYNGPVSLDDQFLKSLNIAPGTVGVVRAPTTTQLTYDLRKAVQLYLGMDNIFNKRRHHHRIARQPARPETIARPMTPSAGATIWACVSRSARAGAIKGQTSRSALASTMLRTRRSAG
jgi:outer membrane receptor protein involved in Fe transport